MKKNGFNLPCDPASPQQRRSVRESGSMAGDLLSLPSGGQISLNEENEREKREREKGLITQLKSDGETGGVRW